MLVNISGYLLPSPRKTVVYDSINGFHIRKLYSGPSWRLDSFCVGLKWGKYVALSFSLRENLCSTYCADNCVVFGHSLLTATTKIRKTPIVFYTSVCRTQ